MASVIVYVEGCDEEASVWVTLDGRADGRACHKAMVNG